MEVPDLANLPLTSVVALALLIAAIDVVTAVVVSIIRKTFSTASVLEYLRSHVLLRVFPILALAIVGHGVEVLGIPAIPAAGLAATASLGLYVVETIGSVMDDFKPAQEEPPSP